MPENLGKAQEKKGDWLKIELFAPTEQIDALGDFLTELGAQGAFQESPAPQQANGRPESSAREALAAFLPFDDRLEERLLALRTYLDSVAELFPELEKPDFRTETIRDPGWGEAWKQYFRPLRASRKIIVKPTWEPFVPAGGEIVIEIDPGMAFGTGQHPSTRMCLEAIEEILLREKTCETWNVLDVGTGTGILGIAAAKLGARRVLCIDVDPKAAEIARENFLLNRVEDRVEIADSAIAALAGTFRLIAANLTANLLIELRPQLARLTAPGGYLILSGIVELNKPDIEKHFPGDSFSLDRISAEKEWLCYVLRKEGGRP